MGNFGFTARRAVSLNLAANFVVLVDVATVAGVLTARITRRSVAELGLAPGGSVWALVEATALRAR